MLKKVYGSKGFKTCEQPLLWYSISALSRCQGKLHLVFSLGSARSRDRGESHFTSFFIRLWRETERERISLETHGTRVRIIPCQKHPRATLPFSSLLAPSILFYFSSGFPPFDDSQSTNIYFSFGQVWFFYYRKCNLIKSVRLNSMLFFFLQFLTIYSLFNFFNNVCFTSFSTIRWGKQCIIE